MPASVPVFFAVVARLDGKTGIARVHELAVLRSDLAFDAASLSDDSWLITGASDWEQNPGGAS